MLELDFLLVYQMICLESSRDIIRVDFVLKAGNQSEVEVKHNRVDNMFEYHLLIQIINAHCRVIYEELDYQISQRCLFDLVKVGYEVNIADVWCLWAFEHAHCNDLTEVFGSIWIDVAEDLGDRIA